MVDALAALITAAGTLVMVAGLGHAAASPRDAAPIFARAVLLTLEFFLAAGLLRLADTASWNGLAITVGVLVTRTLVSWSLKPVAARGGNGVG